ncbi:MAG: hypothetical protein ACFFAS_06895 [Promethearchaeota archaeon]
MKNKTITSKLTFLSFIIITCFLIPTTFLYENISLNKNKLEEIKNDTIPQASGRYVWPENGKKFLEGISIKMINDSFGNIFIVSRRGINIWAQKLNAEGTPQWDSIGIAVSLIDDPDWNDHDDDPELISDGEGGIIVTWYHYVPYYSYADSYICAQRIDFGGNRLWGDEGKALTPTTGKLVSKPKIVPDGAGGAIITWRAIEGSYYQGTLVNKLYATRINANGGFVWKILDIPITIQITTTDVMNYIDGFRMISDGSGGAIIAWNMEVGSEYDVYAKRINVNGATVWGGTNGLAVCNQVGEQCQASITNDGAGGAIIAWRDSRSGSDYDIYAQRLMSSGTVATGWLPNGSPVCIASLDQDYPELCSDGAGGAIICWTDRRNGGYDIYSQHMSSTGTRLWNTDGNFIGTPAYSNRNHHIMPDGSNGVIIVWQDHRLGNNNRDIYAQRISPTGDVQWTMGGMQVCTALGNQENPQITGDCEGGIIVCWEDSRSSDDVYAQRFYPLDAPTVNHPSDFTTSMVGIETIDWTVYDGGGSGQYRVTVLDPRGATYEWVPWSDWIHGTSLGVEVNRSELGAFTYTIEYRDDNNLYGNPDSVIVTVSNEEPTVNAPENVTTNLGGVETIDWIISDDGSSGQYRVLVNDTNGNYYEWIGWTDWTADVALGVDLNRSVPGVFNYTIEYRDNYNAYGAFDTVFVTVVNEMPTINDPEDISTTLTGTELIDWNISDDGGSGQYRVLVNDTNGNYYEWIGWTDWTADVALGVDLNRSIPGVFNYTIEYRDNFNAYGASDTVFVTVVNEMPTINDPEDISTTLTGTELIDWIISDDGGSGQYRVLLNDTNGNYYEWIGWTDWTADVALGVELNRSVPGVFNYTIEYRDDFGIYGQSNTIIVTISAPKPPDDSIILPIVIGGIVIGTVCAIGIGLIMVVRKNKIVPYKGNKNSTDKMIIDTDTIDYD